MDMERDQVRESARQRNHERRMALLVADKEAERDRLEREANGELTAESASALSTTAPSDGKQDPQHEESIKKTHSHSVSTDRFYVF